MRRSRRYGAEAGLASIANPAFSKIAAIWPCSADARSAGVLLAGMGFRGRAGRSIVPRAPKQVPRAVSNRSSEADKLIGQLTKEPVAPEPKLAEPSEPDLTES